MVSLTLQPNKTSFTPRHTIIGKGIAYVKPLDQNLPLRPIEIEFENNHCCIKIYNTSDSTVEFLYRQEMAYFNARSKGLVQTNNSKYFPIDQYLHDRMTPATLSPSPLAYEKPIHPTEMPCITTCTELPADDTNKSTSDDKYPWLDPDDIRRNMTDKEILRMKLNLKDSVLDEKGKEEFLEKVEQFTDVFSLRDEIGTCPFIEVHLKLKDETPFFVRPYPMREEQKKVIQKEMDRLKHLGIIRKGLTSYSSPFVLVKWKNQNLYQVCSDFCILNEKLVKINHAFPLVRDCIEQLGRKKCHYLSMIDLRDAFHTLQLALASQKYCGITPYYGSPTYHYLCMGMGMSVSPQIWQQFVDLVFQDDLIKRKQNFDVIMDDTFMSHTKCEIHVVVTTHSTSVSLLPQCSWAPTERHSSPVEAVLTRSGAALPGLIEILSPLWDTALLAKANTIIMLEGSRLQPGDALDMSRPTHVRHQPHVADKGKPEVRTKS